MDICFVMWYDVGINNRREVIHIRKRLFTYVIGDYNI